MSSIKKVQLQSYQQVTKNREKIHYVLCIKQIEIHVIEKHNHKIRDIDLTTTH